MTYNLEFIGKNIRLFRRERNWTLNQLASKIGIQEGPLGRIERGVNLPSAMVIYNLTQALDIPANALFAADFPQARAATSDKGPVFVIIDSDSTLPPKCFLSACQKLMSSFHALEDILNVQKYAQTPLFIPFESEYAGMEQLSSQVRDAMGIGNAVIFDYLELFEMFGLRVLSFPFMKSADSFDAVSFYEPIHQNAFFFINTKKNSEKQLFSLATELGKILIFNQMKIRNDNLFPDIKSKSELRPINPIRAAKHFAATFLMPETAVRATVRQLGITPAAWTWELLLRIKHRFGISIEAFIYRLVELDLITKELTQTYLKKIQAHYKQTNFDEPGACRRLLNVNGRFFDLLLTADTIESAKDEIKVIKKVVTESKLIKI